MAAITAIGGDEIHIGDSITLVDTNVSEGSRNGGYIFTEQTFEPRLFIRPPHSSKEVHNFRTAVFEVYVPFEYRNYKKVQECRKELASIKEKEDGLDVRQADLKKKLKDMLSGKEERNPGKEQKYRDEIAQNQEKIKALGAQASVLELQKTKWFKLYQTDQANNDREQKRQTGKPLVYGDTIQLRHAFSNKFLGSSTTLTSPLEFRSMRVFLQEHSDRGCIFKVMPRFKVHSEGDTVKAGDQLRLVSQKGGATGQFLSRTQKQYSMKDGTGFGEHQLELGDYEVVLSAQATAWTVDVYSSTTEFKKDPSLAGLQQASVLRAGGAVQLVYKEEGGILSTAELVTVEKKMKEADIMKLDLSAAQQQIFVNTGTDIDGGSLQESMSYWQLYLYDYDVAMSRGDVLRFDTMKVALRHMVSGKYLAVNATPAARKSISSKHTSGSRFTPYMTADSKDPNRAFRLVSMTDNAGVVTSESFCRLQHIITKSYLHTSTRKMTALDLATAAQAKAKGDIEESDLETKSCCSFVSEASYEDVFEIRMVPEDDVDDFSYVKGLKPILNLVAAATLPENVADYPSQRNNRRPTATKMLTQRKPSQPWETHAKQILKVGTQVCREMAAFLLDRDDDVDESEWGQDMYKRQGLVQDLGVLEILVSILNNPLEQHDEATLEESQFAEFVNGKYSLWEEVFGTLLNCSKGSQTSTDKYIARFRRTFMVHSMYLKTEKAAEVLVELFEDNRDILDDLLDERYDKCSDGTAPSQGIAWLVNHLNPQTKAALRAVDHDFYDFLSSLCVCDGLAVRRAQSKICSILNDNIDVLREQGLFCRLLNDDASSTVARMGIAQSERVMRFEEAFAKVPECGGVDYYECPPGGEQERLYILFLANLRLCRSLCDGGSEKVPFHIAHSTASTDALNKIYKYNKVPYALRSAAISLIHETCLETVGHRPMVGKTRKLIYKWQAQHLQTEPQCFTEMHGVPRTYVENLNAIRHATTDSMHQWICEGFGKDLLNFSSEMILIVRCYKKSTSSVSGVDGVEGDGDGGTATLRRGKGLDPGFGQMDGGTTLNVKTETTSFLPMHAEHAEFLNKVLCSIKFMIKAGYYLEWDRIQQLLQVLVKNWLVYTPHLLVGDAEVPWKKELDVLLETTIDILELLGSYEVQASTEKLLEHFHILAMGKANDETGKTRSKAKNGYWSELATLQEAFDKPPRSTYDEAYDKNEVDKGNSYLKHFFSECGLEHRCSIHTMVGDHPNTVSFKLLPKGKQHKDKVLETILLNVAEEGPSLCVKPAMRALNSFFSRKRTLFRDGEKIVLLVDRESQNTYEKVLLLQPQLDYLVNDTQIDEKEAPAISKLVEELRQLMLVDGQPVFIRQDILYKSEILDLVLRVFDQKLDDDDLEAAEGNQLQDALIACLRFLETMVSSLATPQGRKQHEDIRERMFDEITGFLESDKIVTPRVARAMALALQGVFHDPRYQMKVREVHLEQIFMKAFKMYEEGEYVPELLDLLRSTAEAEGSGSQSNARNQLLIVNLIMQHEDIMKILLADDLEERKRLFMQPESPKCQFHAAFVQLMGMLGEGQNQFIESICRKVFTVEQVLVSIEAILNTPHKDQRLFGAYLQFFSDVYLTDNRELELVTTRDLVADKRVWGLLQHSSELIKTIAEQGFTRQSTNFVFQVLTPVFHYFFKSYYRPEKLDNLVRRHVSIAQRSFRNSQIVAIDTESLERDAVVTLMQTVGYDICMTLFDRIICSVSPLVSNHDGNKTVLDTVIRMLKSNVFNAGFTQEQVAATREKMLAQSRARMAHSQAMKVQALTGGPDKKTSTMKRRKRGSGSQLVENDHLPFQHENPMYSSDFGISGSAGPPTSSIDAETNTNEYFRRFANVLWQLYTNNNEAYHECHHPPRDGAEVLASHGWRNQACLYIQEDDNDETMLPCGEEFQEYLEFLSNSQGDPGHVVLLRFLKILIDTLEDEGASDDEKEEAQLFCVETLDVLCAMLQNVLCAKFKDSVQKNDKVQERCAELLADLQSQYAHAGGVSHCLKLIPDVENDVMKGAWRFFSMLLHAGNESVQRVVIDTFNKTKSSKAILRIREELQRGIASLQQLRTSQLSMEADAAQQLNTMRSTVGSTLVAGGTMTMGLSATDMEAFQYLSGSTNAQSAAVAHESFTDINEDEHRWMMSICKGLQLMAEGAYKPLQDYLQEQKSSKDQSVNFVADLCRALQTVYGNVSDGGAWLTLVDQLFDSITELCQGNQKNQQEALDEQIIKMVNAIIAYDSTNYDDMKRLTETKRSALTVVEAMLEENNADARSIAQGFLLNLDREELYLAMNRFYYLDLFNRYKAKTENKEIEATERTEEMQAAFECFYVFKRIEDLTGELMTWPEPRVDTKEPEMAKMEDKESVLSSVSSMKGIGKGVGSLVSGVGGNASKLLGLNKKVVPITEEQKVVSKYHGLDDEVRNRMATDLKSSSQPFVDFCREYLNELDLHGGPKLGWNPDRFHWFNAQTRSIEFMRSGRVQKVYFRKPDTSIPQTIKSEILLTLNLASPQEKVRSFLNMFDEISRKLKFQEKLQKHFVTRLIAEGTGKRWKVLNLVLTYSINIAMLAAYDASTDPNQIEPLVPDWFDPTLVFLGSLHVLSSIAIAIEFFLNNKGLSLTAVYYFLFLALSVLGLFFDGIFYAFHTLHIVEGNDMLQRAMESVTRNGKSLWEIARLIATIVYIFSLVSFLFFRFDYFAEDGQYCDTLIDCFATTLSYGLTHGGGPREFLPAGNMRGYAKDPHYIGRLFFDLSFWVVISIIAMNLVLGIIVDTFSQLRSERAEKMENVRNYCFICSLPSHAFEQGGDANGFARHMKREHGMWSYVYYTLHLKSIDPEEFNYHEKYLHDMLIKEKDITPFPIKNALSLQHHEVDETKEKLTAIQKAFSELKNRLYRRFEESDKEQQSTREIEALWNWQKKNLGGGAGKMVCRLLFGVLWGVTMYFSVVLACIFDHQRLQNGACVYFSVVCKSTHFSVQHQIQ
eukprot:m.1528282 g.1528282  ORF g.1528282 m.1528282 type:complete len:3000 (-) comp25237_c1_seq15:596-9595(-)